MKSKNNDKRLEKGDETYNRILISAVDLISESGIRGITASKLSTLSNVSKSNIFHHFKTTQEIPEAVLNLIFSELIRPIDDSEVESLDEFLNYLGSSVINISKEYKKVYKSFFSFYYEGMFNETYQKILRDFLQTSKEGLTTQIKINSRKSLSDQEADAFSTLIIATLDGIGLHILMEEEREEYLKAWDLQVKFICNTLNNN
jgi:AcrR family transcriptional regulator